MRGNRQIKAPNFFREMNRRQKRMLYGILIGTVLYIAALPIPAVGWLRLLLFLPAYAAAGRKVFQKAAKNIAHGQIFDENFLMCIASLGAMCVGETSEAVAVMLFYQVGELFESCAVGRSRRSIAELMDIRPDCAHVERDGKLETVDPEEVSVGEIIVVDPGERVPLDGTVIEGGSTLDTAALTGESVPRCIEAGETIYSGCINLSGVLRVRVDKKSSESTVSRILELVENASSRKAKTESFITRFARWYTPAVCICAVLLALMPPLADGEWRQWASRALVFLVVSCPCALVISVPLGFFGGIGSASAAGILIKGSNYMEALARTNCVVFDKTGTLTQGRFKVTAVHPEGISAKALLETAALAECRSSHPISASLRTAADMDLDESRVWNIREISGRGVMTEVDGRTVLVGSIAMMREAGIEARECAERGTVVYVAAEGRMLGCIVIADAPKSGSKDAVAALQTEGIRCVMLTGDRKQTADGVAEALGIREAYSELLPGDKVGHVERLLSENGSGTLAFVGDGINDAPVLARADVGIAMGALGSDAAIEAADVVLMDDDPRKISAAIRLSRKTLRIVRQNIVFTLSVKLIVLLLSAMGYANMWLAVFADVGVSVLAILNAMRALRFR